MINRTINIIKKYRESFLYLFFGGLTVIVNIALFIIFDVLGFEILFSNTMAFFMAVAFAYYTNTKFVFESRFTWTNFIRFFGMRIATIFIDNGGMLLLVYIELHKIISKIIVNVIIIVLNYIFSKFFIYKEKV